jgi:hypothetical protein
MSKALKSSSNTGIVQKPKRPPQKTFHLSPGRVTGNGAFKSAAEAVHSSRGRSSFRIRSSEDSEYAIVTFFGKPPNQTPRSYAKKIYAELLMYSKFGALGISPKIHFVRMPGIREPITLIKYLRQYENSEIAPEEYLADNNNCGNGIIGVLQNGYDTFFANLHDFLLENIIARDLINTDIKLDNLCVDNQGNLKIIDLDPNFLQPIPEEYRGPDYKLAYLNYMLYQVYVELCVNSKKIYHNMEKFRRWIPSLVGQKTMINTFFGYFQPFHQ